MDTPDLALPRTESAERCHECERARSERNEDFSPIIHYVPLGAIMPASPTAAAGEFLMKRSAVDLVIDCQIGGRFSTSAFGCSATFKSERERFDRRRSQFDPKLTLERFEADARRPFGDHPSTALRIKSGASIGRFIPYG